MPEPCTVIIGAPELLDALRERTNATGDVLTFSHDDALKALDVITTRQPAIIALERLFAATSRGAALINRIKADPSLASTEIRVVSHDGAYSRVSPRRTVRLPGFGAKTTEAPAALASTSDALLDYRGTRRAPRCTMREGTEAQVDGTSAKIIDLSTIGAQIISPSGLRPQQRVRVVLSDETAVVRLNASVVWASFEIPQSTPRYRAGIEFADADSEGVEAFCRRHEVR